MEPRPTHKLCKPCGRTLPFDSTHFHADSSKKWGLASTCRDCAKKRAQGFYQQNSHHVKAQVRQRKLARAAAGLPVLIDPAKEEARKQKNKQRCKQRYHLDIEVSRAKARARRRPEEDKVRLRRWKENNQDRVRSNNATWKRNNPGRVRSSNAKRKGLLTGANGSYTKQDIEALRVKQQGLCAYCQRPMTKTGPLRETIDHIIALAKDGTNDIENLVLACGECNFSKKDQDMDAFLARTDRPGLR